MDNILIYIANILLIILIAYGFNKQACYGFKAYYWPALYLKIACGLIYGVTYFYYYKTGDTLDYYTEATKLASFAEQDFFTYAKFIINNVGEEIFNLQFTVRHTPRALWMTKATSILLFITKGNYWVISCYLSLFSFIGTYYLAEILLKIYPLNKREIVISFFLFPSFIFWSSGLTKESIAIGSLFFLIAVTLKNIKKLPVSLIEYFAYAVAIGFLLKIRFFYLAVFILTFGTFALYLFIKDRLKIYGIYRWMLMLLLIGSSVIATTQLDYTLQFDKTIEYIYYSNEMNYLSNTENAITFYNLEPNLFSFITNAPIAIVSGLFRPWLLDAKKLILIATALENLLLLIFFILKIKSLKKPEPLEIVVLLYIFLLALSLALSTPNFGSLTRYKVAFLPLFLFLIIKDNVFWDRIIFNVGRVRTMIWRESK